MYVSNKQTSYQSYTADNSKRKMGHIYISHLLIIKVTKMYKDTLNEVTFEPTNTVSHLSKS
jgi:hypothetical protein